MLIEKELIRKIFGKVEIETIIKKLQGKKLKQTEKNYLCRSIRPKLIASILLTEQKILKKINKRKNDENIIIYNLALYNYKLIIPNKIKKSKRLSIEDLIAKIITEYNFPRYIEAIPILIIKNKINQYKMLEIACRYRIKNKIGYLIETAMIIKKSSNLTRLLQYLKKHKDREIALLSDGDYDFLLKTSPKRIKKWNLLGRFFDEDFKKNAEVYL